MDENNEPAVPSLFEWGTRIAVLNANLDAIDEGPGMPMPKWGWGIPGGPYIG